MVARLGRVFYWLFSAMAGLWVAGWAILFFQSIQADRGESTQSLTALIFCCVGGAVLYLIGRAARYVLANE